MKTSLIHISAIVQLFEIFLQARSVTSTLQLEARQSLLKILKKSQRKEAWPGRQAVLKLTTSSLSPSQSLVASFLTTYPPFESIVLLHIWQLALASDDCSLATIKNYRFDIRQFIDFHQELSVSKLLQKPKVISFLKSQANTQSKATLTRKLSSITQFAKFAQEQGWAVDAYHQILPLNQHSSVTIDQVSTQSTQPKSTLPNHSGFFSNLKKSLISPTFSRNKSHNFPGCWQLPLDHLLQNQALNSQPNSNQSPSHNQPTSQSISSSQPSKPTALHFQDARTRLNQRLLSLSQQFAQTQKNQWLPWLSLGFALLALLGIGYFGYQQFGQDPSNLLAYPTTLTRPNRAFSFQGRLTDTAKNPIVSATDMRFKLFTVATGGSSVWDSGTCSIDPDQDGIFSTNLGSDCGLEIDASIFSENANIWLEVMVASETLIPRQPIKTVAYALNSETLQGYPASASATQNTVPVLNNNGEMVLGYATPVIKSTGTSFSLEAQSMIIKTTSGTNGNIVLDPDGLGDVKILGNLDAQAAATVSGNLLVKGQSTFQNYLSAPGATLSATYAGGTALVLKAGPAATSDIMQWQNSGGTPLGVIDKNGNVGIGTTSPSQKLHVDGSARITGALYDSSNSAGSSGYLLTSTGSGTAWGSVSSVMDGTYFKQGGNSYGALATLGTNDAYGLAFETNNTERVRIDTSGNVGIGTTSPTQKLDLIGSLGLEFTTSATTGLIFKNNIRFLHDYGIANTEKNNIFLGLESGSFSLYRAGYDWTASHNIGVGYKTLNSLTYGTTNVAIGSNALKSLTGGHHNLAIGGDTQTLTNTGGYNLSIGSFSLNSNISGSANIAIGYRSMMNATSGNNVSVGFFSGRSLTTGNTNVFIGNESGYHASQKVDAINSIAIGAGTYTTADNQAIYGNGSMSQHIFQAGNVGIGTTSPTTKLDIDGQIRIRGGSPASGRVLVGDASGVGTWTDPTTLPAGSVSFTNITSGTNTTASMVVGTGASLGFTGSGSINASTLQSATWASPLAIGNTTASTGRFTTLEATSTGNALTLSGAGTNIAFTGAGLAQITTASNQHLALMPGGSGNVGIGTTAPVAVLEVVRTLSIPSSENFLTLGGRASDSSSNPRLTFTGIATTVDAARRFEIQALQPGGGTLAHLVLQPYSGNVGIGTTTPGRLLHVAQENNNIVRISNAANTNYVDLGGQSGYLNVKPSSASYGTVIRNSASDSYYANIGANNGYASLSYNNVIGTNSLNINSNGNVGVGLTTTSARLDITGSLTATRSLLLRSGDGSTVPADSHQILFGYNNSDDYLHSIRSRHNSAADLGNAIDFYVWDQGTDAVDNVPGTNLVMSLNGGNVGIGSASPGQTLDVVGNVRISGLTASLPVKTNATRDLISGAIDLATTEVTGILTMNKGGTNKNMTASAGSVAFSDADSLELTAVGTSGFLLTSAGTGTPTWTDPATLVATNNYWDLALGALYPKNSTADLLVGSSATASAKFGFINVNSGTPTASIAGNLAIAAPTGTNPATKLNVFNGGSFGIRTSVGGDAGLTEKLTVLNSGYVGIGTSNPTGKFQVTNSNGPSRTVNLISTSNNTSANGIYNQLTAQGTLTTDRTNTSAYNLTYNNINSGTYNNDIYGAQNAAINSPGGYKFALAVGSKNSVTNFDTSQTNAAAYGSYDRVYNSSTGTISDARGVYAAVDNASTGTIGSGYGGYFEVTNGGTVNNGYGVYIGSIAGTTNYGLYQSSAANQNYFAGNVGIGTTAPGALLQLGTAGTSLGTMRMTGNTSGYVQLQPSAAAGDWTLTLPANDGDSGQVLTTNGSGVTSWAAASSGANTSLSNLSSVAINTSLLPGTDNSIDLGSATYRWRDLYLGPSSLKIYNQADATNFDRIQLGYESNVATLRSTFGGSGTVRPLQLTTGTNIGMYLTTGGLVGINTTAPGSTLEVAGNIAATGTTGFISSPYQIVAPKGLMGAGTGALTSVGTTATGTIPQGLTVNPNGRFAYVTNRTSNTVQTYTINQSTGALTSVGTTATGSTPSRVAVDPRGRFAYVINEGSNTVQAYSINQSTGALTSVGTTATGSNPQSVAVDPSGRFVYVTNYSSNTVQTYTINQSTGALTSVGTTATGNGPMSVAVDPSSRFVYVTNYGANTVQTYTINQSTGALTSVGTTATGTEPQGLAVDPSGRFVYVTNTVVFTANVQAYTINQSTGALTSVGTTATGNGPYNVVVDPGGRLVYVGNYGSNTVQTYTINQSTGALTSVGTTATGTPHMVAVDPSGRFVYATNYFSNTVAAFTINSFSGGDGYFAGNLGIGTTAPAGRLVVVDTLNTAPSFSVTNNTATTYGVGGNTLGVIDLQSTSLTTGNFMNMELNGLTSGKGINLSSTSTGLTTGSMLSVTASGNPGATWTGSLGNFEYLTSTDTDIDGSALKVGLIGAGAGDGVALNVTTGQTGTSAYALRVNDDGTYTDSTPFVIDKEGNVGIGTTAPAQLLHVKRADDGAPVRFEDSNGYCEIDPTSTSWTCTSDERLKKNIVTLTPEQILTNLTALRPVSFEWKTQSNQDKRFGLIAQEVEQIMPELVTTNSDGIKTVSYGSLTPFIISGLQAQQTQIASALNSISELNQKDASVSLNQFGELITTKTGDAYQVVDSTTATPVTNRFAAFTQTITAIAEAGLTRTRDLAVTGQAQIADLVVTDLSVSNINIGGQTLRSYIESIVLESQSTVPVIVEVSPTPAINPSPTPTPDQAMVANTIETTNLIAQSINATGETSLGSLLVEGNAQILGDATVSGKTQLGSLLVDGDAQIAGSLTADQFSATSARISALEAGIAQMETVRATTAIFSQATVSGTLYADTIANLDQQIAAAMKQPSLIDVLFNNTPSNNDDLTVLKSLVDTAVTTASVAAQLDQSIADLNLNNDDVVITGQAAFINQYLKVNGTAYVADSLGVGNLLKVGNRLELTDSYLAFHADPSHENDLNIFSIQPSGKGILSLMAGLMTLDETGTVTIVGDLKVAGDVEVRGTLLSNLIESSDPNQPVRIKVAGATTDITNEQSPTTNPDGTPISHPSQPLGGSTLNNPNSTNLGSRFEIIGNLGQAVATVSGQGKISLTGGINIDSDSIARPDVQGTATNSAQLTQNSTKTTGRATLPAGNSELIIRNPNITADSLVYLTPLGSTNNQVLYVKQTTAAILSPSTPVNPYPTPTQSAYFVVGLDSPAQSDIAFTWWIVN